MVLGWRWLVAAGACVAVAYPWLGGRGQNFAFVVVPLTTVLVLGDGALRRRLKPAKGWLLLAGGQASFMVGDTLWMYFEAKSGEPFPSLADVFYLAGYPLLAAGLLLLLRARAPVTDHGTIIDAAILSVGSATAVWVLFVAPLAADTSVPLLNRSVAAAYPIFDMLLLALLVRLALAPGGRSPAVVLLGGSLLALLGADFLFVRYELRHASELAVVISDVGYLTSYLLIAGAALHHSAAAITRREIQPHPTLTGSRLLLLATASLLGPAILAAQTLRGAVDGIALSLSSACISLLVITRLGDLVRKIEDRAVALAAQSKVDPLTGLGNRRAWDEWVPVELARARRVGTPLCVVMVDLDHFKRYNDRHGHLAGDAFLKALAAAWKDTIRAVDLLARYGGEEFGLVLPGCSMAEAEEIIGRLRAAIPESESCSAGIALWDGAESATELVDRADRALYKAKHAGRGQTVVAEPLSHGHGAPAPDGTGFRLRNAQHVPK